MEKSVVPATHCLAAAADTLSVASLSVLLLLIVTQ